MSYILQKHWISDRFAYSLMHSRINFPNFFQFKTITIRYHLNVLNCKSNHRMPIQLIFYISQNIRLYPHVYDLTNIPSIQEWPSDIKILNIGLYTCYCRSYLCRALISAMWTTGLRSFNRITGGFRCLLGPRNCCRLSYSRLLLYYKCGWLIFKTCKGE